MFKKIIITAICLAGGAFSLFAQTQSPPQQDAGTSVKMNIKIYKWAFSNAMSIPTGEGGVTSVRSSSEADVTLWYKTGSDWKSITVSSGSMSKAITYEGPQRMVFYSKVEGATGAEASYKEACTMTLPLNADETFAMLFKRGSSIRFYPMNVSPKSLPKEKLAIINMTSHNIALMASGDAKFLKSGSNVIITPKRKDNFSIDLQIAKMVKEKWKPVYQNNISIPEDKRCLVLIYDPYNKTSPNFSIQVLTL